MLTKSRTKILTFSFSLAATIAFTGAQANAEAVCFEVPKTQSPYDGISSVDFLICRDLYIKAHALRCNPINYSERHGECGEVFLQFVEKGCVKRTGVLPNMISKDFTKLAMGSPKQIEPRTEVICVPEEVVPENTEVDSTGPTKGRKPMKVKGGVK